jgi:hypothetical protein
VRDYGWQLDPFGHSRTHAYISQQIGFDALFYARIDQHEEVERLDRKEMQFLWETHCGNEILVEPFFRSYNFPPGADYDPESKGGPWNEYGLNAENGQDLDNFASKMRNTAAHYNGRNYIYPFGGDFTFT